MKKLLNIALETVAEFILTIASASAHLPSEQKFNYKLLLEYNPAFFEKYIF